MSILIDTVEIFAKIKHPFKVNTENWEGMCIKIIKAVNDKVTANLDWVIFSKTKSKTSASTFTTVFTVIQKVIARVIREEKNKRNLNQRERKLSVFSDLMFLMYWQS